MNLAYKRTPTFSPAVSVQQQEEKLLVTLSLKSSCSSQVPRYREGYSVSLNSVKIKWLLMPLILNSYDKRIPPHSNLQHSHSAISEHTVSSKGTSTVLCDIIGFCWGLPTSFCLLGYYTHRLVTHRCFGTTHQSHLQGSSVQEGRRGKVR
jgi:hypothetical protein